MKRVAVLASGRGSNLAALIAAERRLGSYRVSIVISNVPGAGALDLAAAAGRQLRCLASQGVPRAEHDARVLEEIRSHGVDLVCLAGYMRVLGAPLIDAVGVPILNIHPSLLPSFPGLHAQRQAVEAGVRVSGATVHFVDAGLDSGPILLQRAVSVAQDDTEQSLASRILEVEHEIYPRAVDIVARSAYRILGKNVIILSSEP